jgi:hypothetical protein
VRITLISIAIGSVTTHLHDFKAKHAKEIADELSLTIATLPDDLKQCLIGEFQFNLLTCAERTYYDSEFISRHDWYMPFVMRSGRHYFLTEQIKNISFIRDHSVQDNLVWSKAQMDELEALKKGIPTPGLMLKGVQQTTWDGVIKKSCETLLKSQLLVAELNSQPWPQDIFDPTGSLLRPFLRDGKIIGAYTVSSDGVDNSGDKRKDRYFPLYGPLELPVAPTSP